MTGLAALALALVAGRWFGLPRATLWAMAICGWLALLLASAPFMPQGNPVQVLTGARFAPLALLGGGVALALAYRAGLRRLRARAALRDAGQALAGAAAAPAFSAAELERYARHIALREIGGTGQRQLKAARVLVVGAGGLGSPALMYLAAAGVGSIGVIDDDVVSLSNLQRQIVHADARIGMPKVFSAQVALTALNPHVTLRPWHRRLTAADAPALFAEHDLILDGSDSFATRALVNAAAVATGKPLISGAIAQWEGQVGLFHPAAGGPCYACAFPTAPAPGLAPACAEAGVMGALPGIVGAMMAAEAIKWLTQAGTPLLGRLVLVDALHGENRTLTLRRNPACPVCGGGVA